jgi:cell wall-associated NlpC family hydrolase
MNWKSLLPTLGPAQTIARAQSIPGLHTIYKLGAGGITPADPFPLSCDCSGFVAWSIGIPRELPPGSGHWLFTDAIWSGGSPHWAGLFTPLPMSAVLPGDLLVYPHNRDGRHGHVGIVLATAGGLPLKVIHCSLGNYTHYGDAVCITDPGVFLSGNHPTRVMRINYASLNELV